MVKKVDSRAVSELTNPSLCAIAGGPNYRANSIDPKDMNDQAFECKKAYFDSRSKCFRTHVLKANPQGKLCALAMQIINSYGIDIHDQKAKHAPHTSGGHTVYRTLINAMIAKNLSMFLRMVYCSNRDAPIVMYNLGAKFLSDKTILNRCTEVDVTSIYPIHDG